MIRRLGGIWVGFAVLLLLLPAGSTTAHQRPCVAPTPSPVVTPAPTPIPTPVATPSGWHVVFDDQFTNWDPARYFVYPRPWDDTSNNGRYGYDNIASDGSRLRVHLWTNPATGVREVAAFVPLTNGTDGDESSMRIEFRMRADLMPGYKAAPLLWPASNVWPRDGELDWPEGDFNGGRPTAFMHRQGATTGSDQDAYPAPSGITHLDWHTYAMEWVAGEYAAFYVDGQLIGRSTSRVPNTPMHFVMQLETSLSSIPAASTSGYVEIDYLTVWTR